MKSEPNVFKFTESIKEIYGQDYNKVVKGLNSIKPTTFRINTQKAEKENTLSELRELGFHYKIGPFENSFIITRQPDKTYISDTNAYNTGAIYLQELSSMIPPILLIPQPNEKILDIAAAPGSKTTQIADLAKNEADITAIEKHPIRIKTLYHNITQQASKKVKIIEGNGIKFDRRNPQFIEYFDKVLVDAPCSSEGRFNLSDSKSYKYWNINKRKDMSKVQKGLLISGYRMLKPGGTLVYSTCTFGVEENELVLEWFLQKYITAQIQKVNLPINNVKRGITNWKDKKLNPKINNSLRIIPNELFTGFFVAVIKKE